MGRNKASLHLRKKCRARHFFGLPFRAEIGSESLLAAIDLVRCLDSNELKALPVDAPCDFVPAAWRAALEREDGSLERNIWEIALGLAVRDALRAGDLNLAESRKHVSFWNLVYDENQRDSCLQN